MITARHPLLTAARNIPCFVTSPSVPLREPLSFGVSFLAWCDSMLESSCPSFCQNEVFVSLAILHWQIRHWRRAMLRPATCSSQQGCAGVGMFGLPDDAHCGPGAWLLSCDLVVATTPSILSARPRRGLILHVSLN